MLFKLLLLYVNNSGVKERFVVDADEYSLLAESVTLVSIKECRLLLLECDLTFSLIPQKKALIVDLLFFLCRAGFFKKFIGRMNARFGSQSMYLNENFSIFFSCGEYPFSRFYRPKKVQKKMR